MIDRSLNKEINFRKQIPVMIVYTIGNKRYRKKPDKYDLDILKKIETLEIPYWFPNNRMPEGDESRRNDKSGVTHVHHFFTKRNLWVLSAFAHKIGDSNHFMNVTSVAGVINNLYRFEISKRYFGCRWGSCFSTYTCPH